MKRTLAPFRHAPVDGFIELVVVCTAAPMTPPKLPEASQVCGSWNWSRGRSLPHSMPATRRPPCGRDCIWMATFRSRSPPFLRSSIGLPGTAGRPPRSQIRPHTMRACCRSRVDTHHAFRQILGENDAMACLVNTLHRSLLR